MAFPQSHSKRRAQRVRLATLVAASVQQENGQRTKGKLCTVSITGGLLELGRAFAQGDFVEIAFQTDAGKIQGLAEMLDPFQQQKDAVLQPFRFVALGDSDDLALRMTVAAARDRVALQLNMRQPA